MQCSEYKSSWPVIKTLRIRNLRQMARFCNKLVSFLLLVSSTCLGKHSSYNRIRKLRIRNAYIVQAPVVLVCLCACWQCLEKILANRASFTPLHAVNLCCLEAKLSNIKLKTWTKQPVLLHDPYPNQASAVRLQMLGQRGKHSAVQFKSQSREY